MRTIKFPSGLLVSAIFAVLLASTPACDNSTTSVGYNEVEIFVGFRALNDPGSTQDYLVDIGQASQFTGTNDVTLDLGSIAADLACQYGSDWYNRTDLLWAVIGADAGGTFDPENTLYTSNPDYDPFIVGNTNTQGTPASDVSTMAYFSYDLQLSTINSPVAIFQDAFADFTYAFYQDNNFDFFGSSNEGIPSQYLYFNRLMPSFTQGTLGERFGWFFLFPDGTLTFTADANGTPTPTPTPTPTATPTPTVTPTITPSVTPTVTPSPTPPTVTIGNISTRVQVDTGEDVLIGGFIITGSIPKKVLVRALGPSLPVAGGLLDPVLDLYNSAGQIIAENDNWMDAPNRQEIIDSTIPPTDDHESAVLMDLSPSSYTAVVRGVNNSTGIGLVEAYDIDHSTDSLVANMSTRGFVQTGDKVMIGGLILTGSGSQKVMVRALGPSLSISGTLPDPVLELYDSNGILLAANDNWRDTQEAEIIASGISPSNDAESAIIQTLAPASYTAIVRGKGIASGVALVEFYSLPQ